MFWAELRVWAAAGLAPPPGAFLWATCPTLELNGQLTRVPLGVSVELHAGPATQSNPSFPVAHLFQQVSHPHRGRIPRDDLGSWGLGGVQPWFRAWESGPGIRDPRPRTGSPLGSQACGPPGRPRVWLWLILPHPAPRPPTGTQGLQLSTKSVLNHPGIQCDHFHLSPPELTPPSP